MEENFKSLENPSCREFVDQFHENSDRTFSNSSDKLDQKLRKLPRSKLIEKLSVKTISIKKGSKGTRIIKKEPKNRQLIRKQRTFELMTTKQRHAPNDITESSDPARSNFSNNVLQIMQNSRPLKERDSMRSFLDMTDMWTKRQATNVSLHATQRSN